MDKLLWEALVGKKIAEKRKSRRILSGDQFAVEFRQRQGNSTFTKGYASDLSVGGIAFTTMSALQPGSLIEVVLLFSPEFPATDRLTLLADVVRVEFGSGKFIRHVACRFREPSASHVNVIRQFILWLIVRNLDGYFDDKVWKVSANDQFYVEFQHSGQKCRGFGSHLSLTGIRFTCATAPLRGSTIPLQLFYSPHFPGPGMTELPAVVLHTEKAGTDQSVYNVQCRLDSRNTAARQTLQAFLKWLVTYAPAE